MRTVWNHVKKIIYGLCFLLMGVQIVAGLLWLCGNLTAVQEFAETAELLEISKTWVLDEYVGIAYPICIWMVRIPALLYVLQVAAAFGAGVYFLNRNGVMERITQMSGKWTVYYGAAYLVTVPMMLQCHMAVLPFSFAYSVFLVLLADCIQLFWSREPMAMRKVAKICGMWLLGALFMPDYGWLGGIPVLLAFFGCIRGVVAGKSGNLGKAVASLLLAFGVTVSAIAGTACVTQTPGSRGRIQKSFHASMLSRFVWPNFDRNSYFWNVYITDVCDPATLLEISQNPENVIYQFGPMMEQAYGRKMADDIYRQMAEVSLQMRTKEIMHEIVNDGLAYLCPQVAVQRHLDGKGISYTGWNYSRMQHHSPVLTKYYVNCALSSWNILAVLAILGMAVQLAVRVKQKKQNVQQVSQKGMILFPVVTILTFAVWYTMSAGGMQDYRNVLIVWALWAILAIKGWEAWAENEKA